MLISVSFVGCKGAYSAGGAGVGLDTASILTVGDSRVGERNAVEVVIALASNGTDAKPVAANACHTRNEDVGAAGHGDAVVLVVDYRVLERQAGGGGYVEAIRVVSGSQAVTGRVRRVSGSVVEVDATNSEAAAAGDGEAVDGPVLDV